MWLNNSSRIYLLQENIDFAKNIPENSMVLDAGAGEQPYKHLFNHCTYESCDFASFDGLTTYVCDLTDIPVDDNRFDYVVFNQALEHVPDPWAVLKELHRVLKKGGKLLCTCPLFYEEHSQPYDFYRYTQFAHKQMFTSAGFGIDRLDWMEGYFGTVGYQFETMYKYLPLRPRNYSKSLFIGLITAPIGISVKFLSYILAGIFYRIDIENKFTKAGYPKNYTITATKN